MSDQVVGRICHTSALVLFTVGLFLGQQVLAQDASSAIGAVQVLFLGDDGHHQPATRAQLIQPAFARRGIQLTYTESLDDLNSGTLSGYDVVMIYANHTHINADQEQALFKFVRQGGGLVPVHSASACFGNSEAYVKLIGGAFKAHGTGVFTTTRIRGDHPAIAGVPRVENWDETYVHQKHNPDKIVLSVRVEGDHEEPWTWVRTPGKGRVYYTAWGHDERTWSNAAFQQLLARGVRWAAGDGALEAGDNVPPLRYDGSEVPLPYYPEGERWGTTGEPIRQLQQPLGPTESMQHTVVPPGFALKLFASEPDIVNPIDMAWDAQGRLWIAETIDYPNQVEEEPGDDRIRIVEDTDGDGRADKYTTFAEGLNIPTSLTLANGGVIVSQAPHMLFLRDTDGDGRADVRRRLSSGWGTFDTHAGPSNLQYGFDNQIWGAVGYSGFQGTVGGEELEFGQGFYRFPSDGSTLEYLITTSNNTWGLGFNEEGVVFGSTANGNPAVYMAMPRHYYGAVRGWEAPTLGTIADSDDIYPLTDHVRQVDHHGRYTAGAGFHFYTARKFPEMYWNRIAFVGAPTGHLLGKFAVESEGAGFVAKNAWNMLASRDEWVAPVAAKVGPDGMLWVIDWYNLVVQHNPTPEGFESGEGNAYETPLRDRKHARIYRIVPAEAASTYEPMNLSDASPSRLVQAFRNDNLFWRLTAQRLLVERGQQDIFPQLFELVRDESIDAVGNNPGALHALWTLDGLGAFEAPHEEAIEEALDALYHPAPGVRRAALMVLPRTRQVQRAILDTGVLPEPAAPGDMDYTVWPGAMQEADAQVRLTALLALSETPSSERAGKAIARVLRVPQNVEDPWIQDALIAAGAQHDVDFLRTALESHVPEQADSTYRAAVGEVIGTVSTHYAMGTPSASVAGVLVDLAEAEPFIARACLRGLIEGWPEDAAPSFQEQERARLAGLHSGLSEDQQSLFQELAAHWGMPNLFR